MRLIICSVFLLSVQLWISDTLHAQNFRIRLTLTADSIHDVYQDSLGTVWLACSNGLYSYNGRTYKLQTSGAFKTIYPISLSDFVSVGPTKIVRVKNLTTPTTETILQHIKSINPATITNIVGDQNNLVIQTTDGFFISNKDQRVLKIQVPHYSPGNSILSTQQNQIRLITPQSVYRWTSTQNSFSLEETFPIDLKSILHYAVRSDSKKELLIVTESGIFIKTNDGKFKQVEWRGLPQDFLISTIHYYQDRILLGSLRHGFWIGKPSSLGGYTFSEAMDGSDAHRTLHFPFMSIKKILITNDGISLWVLHEKGLSLLQESLFTKISMTVPLAAFDQAVFTSDGTVYLESDNGIFICKKNEVGDYTSSISKRDVFAYSPAIGGRGDRIWFGSRDYSLMYLEGDKQKEIVNLSYRGQSLFFIYPDRDNNAWILQAPGVNPITGLLKVTYKNEVIDYNETKGFESRMLSIKEDRWGNLFAAGIGENSYLYKYDKLNDRFINISVPMNFDYGESFEVHDLTIGHDSTIWLCTTTGLLKYKNGKIERILIEELYGSEVISADIDKEGNLWIGTNLNGVLKISSDGYYIFDQNAGLAINTMSYRGLYAREDGSIWVASEEGFFISSPKINESRKTKTPTLLSINKEPFTATSKTVYPFKSNLSFDFLSMTFPVNTIEYSYKLSGYNNDRWTKLSQYDSLVLTNLTEGNYQLQIKARQRGGYQWSDPMVFNFMIEEVWYLKIESILLYIAVFILCTIFGVKYYNTRLLREKRILEEKIAQRTREITKKNGEILEQNEELKHLSEEIASQRDSIEKQNTLLEQSKRDLELKVLERTTELSKANDELTEQNSQLEQYAYMTAHNLRAPIARLIGLTHIFNEKDFTDAINFDVIKRVKHSVHELDDVVHDINTILQVKKGANASVTQVNLADTIHNVLATFAEELNQRHIRVTFQHQLDVYIAGIEPYVFSVFYNVISNSIKYSSYNEASTIDIQLVNNENSVQVVIVDNGTGFDLQPEKIFKPFSRFHAEGEGKGLGLYMIKIQMESMQGSVEIQSSPGKGTTVFLTFRKLNTEKS